MNERERLLEKKYPPYLIHDPVFGERLEGIFIQSIVFWFNPIKKITELIEQNKLEKVEKQATEFI